MKRLEIPSLAHRKWVDRDELMLHAMFQILTDFVEKEIPNEEQHVFGHGEEMVDVLPEIKELYAWWQSYKSSIVKDEEVEEEMIQRLIKIRPFLWT